MKRTTIILILLTLGTLQVGVAQKKSKKKSKEARKTEQYQRYKQALADTTFFFQTEKILLPYTPYNGTGGYFAIEPSKVRVQEIDIQKGNEKMRFEGKIKS